MKLVVEGLGKRYARRWVLRDLNLTVQPGQIIGLLGPNGAGKSTAFGVIAGLLSPSSGSVRLGSNQFRREALHQRVRMGLGYLPQGPSVFRTLTVKQNLTMALEGLRQNQNAVEELLASFELADLAHAKAQTLSGGERRRLEIARAVAGDPQILLLDEPFGGVDPVGIDSIAGHMQALRDRGIGILLTDHAVHAALPLCDGCTILDQGQVIAEGMPDEVAHNPVVRARYLGPQPMATNAANEPIP